MHTTLRARAEEMVVIAGSFPTDGSAVVGTAVGKGFTVTNPSTGVYRIAFTSDGTRKYPRIISVVGTLLSSNLGLKVTSATASNGYVEFTAHNAGVATNLVSGGLHFAITVQNTGI
jgi:hypothetical protein